MRPSGPWRASVAHAGHAGDLEIWSCHLKVARRFILFSPTFSGAPAPPKPRQEIRARGGKRETRRSPKTAQNCELPALAIETIARCTAVLNPWAICERRAFGFAEHGTRICTLLFLAWPTSTSTPEGKKKFFFRAIFLVLSVFFVLASCAKPSVPSGQKLAGWARTLDHFPLVLAATQLPQVHISMSIQVAICPRRLGPLARQKRKLDHCGAKAKVTFFCFVVTHCVQSDVSVSRCVSREAAAHPNFSRPVHKCTANSPSPLREDSPLC